MLTTLESWYNWQELISLTSVIAFKREGVSGFEDAYKRLTAYGADIIIVDDKITDISSTKLRKKIEKSLLPERVYNYIVEKGIYNV